MSTVNPVTSTNAPATQPKSTMQTLGKDDFLKLLVGQLQHQDPLAPSDDQQWIGQMAAFSQVAQVSNPAEASQDIGYTLNRNGTLSLIGHTVSYLDEAGAARSGVVSTVDVAGGTAS